MIQALIFDFDGLILDTEQPEFQTWQEIYAAHGCELSLETWAACIGTTANTTAFDPYRDLEDRLGHPIDREGLRAHRRQRTAEMIRKEKPLPGVLTYLTDAKRSGLKVGVASSSSRAWVRGHLVRLGLWHYFDYAACGDEVPKGKPEPDLYLAALDGLAVLAEAAVAFEDSPNGALAAQRAGIFCVVVPNSITRQLTFEHADLRLDSLVEMPLPQLLLAVHEIGLGKET